MMCGAFMSCSGGFLTSNLTCDSLFLRDSNKMFKIRKCFVRAVGQYSICFMYEIFSFLALLDLENWFYFYVYKIILINNVNARDIGKELPISLCG